jgi:hypothetical protein
MKTKQPAPLPRKIRVGDKEYSVEIVETLKHKADLGRIYFGTGRIEIAQRSDDDQRKQTFWHELVHAILVDMERNDLNRNEQFVDGFAQRLHDAIKSARF